MVAPIERRADQAELRRAAARLTAIVVDRRPDLVTDRFRKADRAGRVMLDPSRNGTGATIVAPYSPRARPGAPVSFPIAAERDGSQVLINVAPFFVSDWADVGTVFQTAMAMFTEASTVRLVKFAANVAELRVPTAPVPSLGLVEPITL